MSAPARFRRGDVVYARVSVHDVPQRARGVVLDVYPSCAVVAFRWGQDNLHRVARGDVEGEKILEVGLEEIQHKVTP